MTTSAPLGKSAIVEGLAGPIEVLIDVADEGRGIAVITHPHPLFGGANTNKVTYTLARTLRDLGYHALRPNFRGVGKTAGTHDNGQGETEDMLAVLDWAQQQWPKLPADTLILAGFSFGAYVQTRVAQGLLDAGRPPAKRLILVGTAAGHVEGARQYDTGAVAANTLVIHGSNDETVPLPNVLAWAEPLELPVVVVAGADHFFHGRLQNIRDIINRAMPD